MKIFGTLMFACVLSIAACGGGKKTNTTPKDTTTSNTGSGSDAGSAAGGMRAYFGLALLGPHTSVM